MQRLTLLLLLTPLALAAPQEEGEDVSTGASTTDDSYSLPSSISAPAVLSGVYGTNTPSAATGAVATSLASALYSYELELHEDPGYLSAANAVYMAMATASDSDAIMSSIETAGAMRPDYTTAEWFKTGVPKDAQTAIESYYNEYNAIETSVLGAQSGSASVTGTGSSDAEATPTETGATSSSSGGAAGPTRVAMAGLAAGVALGAFAAV